MMHKLDFAIFFVVILTFVSDAHDKQKIEKLPSHVLCKDEKCLGTLSYARVVNSGKCHGGNLKKLSAGKRVEIFAKDVNPDSPLWGVKLENLRCFIDKSFVKEINVISKITVTADNPLLPKTPSENNDDSDETEDNEDMKDKPTGDSRQNARKTLDSSKVKHEDVPPRNNSSISAPSKDQSENTTPPAKSDGSRGNGTSPAVPETEASKPDKSDESHNEKMRLSKDASSPAKSKDKTEPMRDASTTVKLNEMASGPAKDTSSTINSNEGKTEPMKDASTPIKADVDHSYDVKNPETLTNPPQSDGKKDSHAHINVENRPKQMNGKVRESKELPTTEEPNTSVHQSNDVKKGIPETQNEKADISKDSTKDDSEKDTEDDEGNDDGTTSSSPDRKPETIESNKKLSDPKQSSKLADKGLMNENHAVVNLSENDSPKEASMKSVEKSEPKSSQLRKDSGDSSQSDIKSKKELTTKETDDIQIPSKNIHSAGEESRDTNIDASEKERPSLQEKPTQDMSSKSLKIDDLRESKESKSVPVPSSSPETSETSKSKNPAELDMQISKNATDNETSRNQAEKTNGEKSRNQGETTKGEKSRNQAETTNEQVLVPPTISTADDRLKKLRINAARRTGDQQLNIKGSKHSKGNSLKFEQSEIEKEASVLPKKSDSLTDGVNLKGDIKASIEENKKPGLSVNDPWLSSSKTELERCFRRFSERNFLISTLIYIIDVIRMPGRFIISLMPQDTVKPLNDVLWTYSGISLELLFSGTLLFGYLLILSLLFQCCLCRRNFKADLMKKADIVIALEEKISERDQLNSKLSDNNIHLIKKIKEMEKRVSDDKRMLDDESRNYSLEKKQSEELILSLNEQIGQLTIDKRGLEERVDALQHACEDSINAEIQKCEVRVAELHSALSDKDKESERLNSIIADMNDNQTQLVEQANSYYESMTQMQKEVEKMHNDRNALEQSLLSKDGEITQLRQSFQFLKSVQEIVDSEVNKEFSEGQIVVDSAGQPKTRKQRSNSLHKDEDDATCSDDETSANHEDDADKDDTAVNEAIEARKSEVLRTKLAEFLNISQLRIEMQTLQEHCLSLESKLRVAEDSRGEMELRLDELKRENNSLQTSRMEAEERQKVAQNKLDILSQYFKEREAEMQRNMGEQEVLKNRNANQMETHKSRAEILESEIGDMKKQLEAMEGELRESERSYRKQINELEKRAFDNWKASRTSEREVKEMKEENFALRQRLTEVERSRIPPLPSFQGMPRMPAQTKPNSGAAISSPINTNPSFPLPPMLPPSMPPMPPMPFMMPPRPPLGMGPNMGADVQRPPSRQSLESETSRADAASMGRSFTNSDGRPLSRTSGVVPSGGMTSTMPPPPSSMPFMPPPPGMRMPPPSFPAMPPPLLTRSPIGMMPNRQQHQKSPSMTSSTRPPR